VCVCVCVCVCGVCVRARARVCLYTLHFRDILHLVQIHFDMKYKMFCELLIF